MEFSSRRRLGAPLLLAALALGSCDSELPEGPWAGFEPVIHCLWTAEHGVCVRGRDGKTGVLWLESDLDPDVVPVREGWGLAVEQGRRSSTEIPRKIVDAESLEEGFSAAAVLSVDELPPGRAVALSQWATRAGGRSFELGVGWDGHPYFMVSGNGETSDLGIVYGEGPLPDGGTVLLVGAFDPEAGLALYGNGERIGSNDQRFPDRLFVSETPLTIGHRPGCSDDACSFDGAVGDAALFDRSLTDEEHRDLAAALGFDEPPLRPFEEPAVTTFDLAAVGERVQERIADLDSGRGPGAFLWNPWDEEPQLYSSADVAWMLWIMDELGSLSVEDRQAWIAFLQSAQDPEDGSYDGPGTHDELHALAHVTVALNALGGGHALPPRFIDPLLAPAAVGPWLDQRDWYYQWGSSCSIWGLGLTALSSEGTPPEWREALFAWLDSQIDPEIGAWRAGHDVRHRVDYLGGGFHIWALYAVDGRPIPYAERVVDLALSLQRPNGDFGRGFGCGVLDGVWVLVTLREQTDYRRAEVDVALRRSLHGLMELVDRGLFVETGSHGLLSRVGTLALLQRALPAELRSERPWRDPWTDPALYRLH